jgi:hypothetical protein
MRGQAAALIRAQPGVGPKGRRWNVFVFRPLAWGPDQRGRNVRSGPEGTLGHMEIRPNLATKPARLKEALERSPGTSELRLLEEAALTQGTDIAGLASRLCYNKSKSHCTFLNAEGDPRLRSATRRCSTGWLADCRTGYPVTAGGRKNFVLGQSDSLLRSRLQSHGLQPTAT